MNENKITLNFRIKNEVVPIDNVNLNQPLSVSVQKALNKSNQVRPIEDWIATFEGNQLDISKKVKDLGLSDGNTIKLTLKDGGGGVN